MAVPSYDRFIEPILRCLAHAPEGLPASEAHDASATRLGLSEEDRSAMLPSGTQPIFKNRAGWAHDRLKRAGLSSSPKRGHWRLTEQGRAFVDAHPTALDEAEIERLANGFTTHRLRDDAASIAVVGSSGAPTPAPLGAGPEERLEKAVEELKESVGFALLDALGKMSPRFFETTVLHLLHAMGYGATRADLQRVGGSGDGGIDGIISLDRLGFEKVYVQAKRWQGSVGRPDVQAFYGALAGQRATKGVLITTSTFTAQAVDFARSVERVVLVDGEKLSALMVEHGVGVTHQLVKVPRLDGDFFDE